MEKNTTTVKPPYADLGLAYNNGVLAAYIIGKDILEVEDQSDLLGVPFLVWTGSWSPIGTSVEKARSQVGVDYLSSEQFKNLESQVISKGGIPAEVTLRGRTYPARKLGSCYVPFSFGIYHGSDVENKTKIRSLPDYEHFMKNVLPKVACIRSERAKRKAEDGQLWNRALASLGLREQKVFDRYQPVVAKV